MHSNKLLFPFIISHILHILTNIYKESETKYIL